MSEGLMISTRSVCTRRWPEILVGLLACLVFLGSLGSIELWGKREQRAAAEALDTVENGHWLVAEIQGRPRLEKPPLPRWTAAALLAWTGRRDEWIIRLPGALAGLAIAGLVYSLGRAMGGRGLGLAAAMILCTTALFVSELRQAGNDGPLALFTTLALYAAWRRLHGARSRGERSNDVEVAIEPPGDRKWSILFHAALGLGFLCKGPIILLLAGFTVVPSLAVRRRLRSGLRQLADPLGLVLFLALAASWPILVVLNDPEALGVWATEMGQKTGALAVGDEVRSGLALGLPLLSLPWAVLAVAGTVLPCVPNRQVRVRWKPEALAFVWWWSIGNLAMFSLWSVAKPNYFVPCLAGLALLAAMTWIRLCRVARNRAASVSRRWARGLLWLQFSVLLVCGAAAPALSRTCLSDPPAGWLAVISVLTLLSLAVGFWIWRRGGSVRAIVPFTGACALGVVIAYGPVARVDNPARGHRSLASRLERIVPSSATTIRFFHEIDEGLWFYMKGRRLAPVPGSQPQYSNAHDKLGRPIQDKTPRKTSSGPLVRTREQIQALQDWVRGPGRDEPYFLIRSDMYERLAPNLAGLVTPLFQESETARKGLLLLRVNDPAPRVAAEGSSARR